MLGAVLLSDRKRNLLLTAFLVLLAFTCLLAACAVTSHNNEKILLEEKNSLLEKLEQNKSDNWKDYRSTGSYQTRIEGFIAAEKQEGYDVVFVGDSLIENWQIDESFLDYSCFNMGISGDVTEGVINRLNLVDAVSPKIVVLEVGTNDLRRYGDVDLAASNMKKIVDELIRIESVKQIIILGLLPTPANEASMNEMKQTLNRRYEDLSLQNDKITYIDLFEPYSSSNGFQNDTLFCDSMHLSAEGYKKMVSLVEPCIASFLAIG